MSYARKQISALADQVRLRHRHLAAVLDLWAQSVDANPDRVAAEARQGLVLLAAMPQYPQSERTEETIATYQQVVTLCERIVASRFEDEDTNPEDA